MNTKIVYEKDLTKEALKEAGDIIRNGGIVAFPTETVYGLGASAINSSAVSRIFEAKGRPSDNPLIVHIWDMEQVERIGQDIPKNFYKLAEKFWPGPLTMIVKKRDVIPANVSGGLDTIGIRMPSHPIAYEFLKECNLPIAAPSSNISGKPSPTNVKHVIQDMKDRVDMIIDGGECDIGVESTVIDLTSSIPTVLRPGGITTEELEEVLDAVLVDKHIFNNKDLGEHPRSPGMKYRHYAPNAKVIMVEGNVKDISNRVLEKVKEYECQNKNVGILATIQTKEAYNGKNVKVMGDRNEPITISKNLFKLFREFDEEDVDVIVMEGVDSEGIGMAIVNRMLRASE